MIVNALAGVRIVLLFFRPPIVVYRPGCSTPLLEQKAAANIAGAAADFGNPEQMNRQFQKMIRVAEDIVLFAVQKQIEDPVEFLDDYIKSKSRKVSTGMMRTYNVMKNRLLDFQKWRKQKISFTSFDFDFYEDFVKRA